MEIIHLKQSLECAIRINCPILWRFLNFPLPLYVGYHYLLGKISIIAKRIVIVINLNFDPFFFVYLNF
jgi:hypothetical protein